MNRSMHGRDERMKKRLVIPAFEIPGGKHCETTALRTVLINRGVAISEETPFGLSGGLGFIY